MSRPARPIPDAANEALIRVASDHFARVGFQAASLNDILTEAGWAKSSFYHRFRAKRDLHDYVVEQLRDRLTHNLDPPAPDALTSADLWEQMSRLVRGLEAAAAAHPETRSLGVMFHADTTAPVGGQLERTRAGVSHWLACQLHRAEELRLLRDDIPTTLALTLTPAVLAALDRWVLDQAEPAQPPDPVELVRRLIAR